MSWKKYSLEDRKIPGISGFAIILIIVSLYIQSKLVLFLAVFFLIVIFCNQLYLKRTGEKLYFENLNVKNYFFIGDKGEWFLTFRNEGFPILKAELRIYFDFFVSPDEDLQETSLSSMYEMSIPFSLFTNQAKQIKIPFTAKQRGIAKIRSIEFRVPSLLGFGETVLESKYFVKQQAVVYPLPIPVKGLKEQISVLQGIHIVPISVYEELLGPVGTRDYVPSDSFNRIHWKASARKQELQTKVYERISEKGWNIALNVSDGHSITGKLEKLLSSITEFAYYAFHKQIPYSLCINVRTAGSTPFLYLPIGEGKEHLQKVLETLASVSTQNTSLPYDYMLSFYNSHLTAQPYFIHAGIKTDDTKRMLLGISKKGAKLFELKIEQEFGLLSELAIHQERRMLL
ncbi:DUF58 domain-containing protein [Neobacillus vireti]|uniref:DUF58 domain-containing protein n=1 Tax=Neobacillus vireti LMG 21834 TaxID=1131730 RepID=A0AB94IM05_9BACI|nr:DUF58 domain-containing protein [Neobacillus vireti]ETI68084.1 hypothetical protein BAVI_14269 [Neobacillus vireti LMG 21834]